MAEENDDDDDEDGGERHVYLMVRLMVSIALIYPDICTRTIFTCRHPLNVASLFIFGIRAGALWGVGRDIRR